MAKRIAIDGPVGSGKTAAGRLLARRLGYMFLDTGMMYRAMTVVALRRSVAVDDPEALGALARKADVSVEADASGAARVMVDGEDVTASLREAEVDRNVSAVSAVPKVREVMVRKQREAAMDKPVVMAGRDIGTVVLTDADLKVYLDAAVETRADRRMRELLSSNKSASYADVLESLRRRDRLDSSREVSPLRPAEDAHVIKTDSVPLEQVADQLERLARQTPSRCQGGLTGVPDDGGSASGDGQA